MFTHLHRRLSLVMILTLALFLAVVFIPAPAVAQDTPDQGLIVFLSQTNRDGDTDSLRVMNADGSGMRYFATGQLVHFAPQWSADGQFILFGTLDDGLVLFDPQTGRPRRVIRTGLTGAWSPSEQQIAYTDYDYVMRIANADGSGSRPLSSTWELYGDVPSWSPDGRQILFDLFLSTESGLSVLARINADDTDLRVLDIGDGFIPFSEFLSRLQGKSLILRAYDGEWSPDGQKIVFWTEGFLMLLDEADGSGAFAQTDPEIFVVNADGRDVQNLTRDKAAGASPSWSPDGSQIVFVSDRDGDMEICVMDADGGNFHQLTHNQTNDFNPDWWAPSSDVELAPTPTQASAGVERCAASAPRVINLRTGPGTTFEVARQSTAGETLEIDGQVAGGDGFTWYRLTTGEWAREDVIDEAPGCLDVPRVP